MTMKKKFAPAWVVDYGAARAHALKWLGDRYLLAKPIYGGRLVSGRTATSLAVAKPPEEPLTATAKGRLTQELEST